MTEWESVVEPVAEPLVASEHMLEASEGSPCVASGSEIVLRELRTWEEYGECVPLQEEVWGEGFTGCVPPAILMVAQKVGGVTAGAFDGRGRLLGLVFGITGIRDGRPVHWSDRLAVRPEARGLGLGHKLKAYQRQLLLQRGVEVAYWTFDPLVARNAHLNLNRLGAEVVDYVCDMYGSNTGSQIHSGLGSDRFVVVWNLRDPRVEEVLAGARKSGLEHFAVTPIVNAWVGDEGEQAVSGDAELWETDALRVEIPAEIEAMMSADRELALRWRATTRRAFLESFKAGYRVRAFGRDPQSGGWFYGLTRSAVAGGTGS